MSKQYDVVVLGGGPGGYVAAIKAAQLGKTVAIVERDKLGGTCLHRGCIPSKSMLRSAEVYAMMKDSEAYGIEASGVALHMGKVHERKARIVDQLHQGVQYLMKKNKIDVYHGNGRVIGPSIFSPRSGSVAVELADGESEMLVPQHLIIATGSRPRTLPGLTIDGVHVMTSDEAFEMETLPESIIIVGGGVIGVEWASMLNDFGVKVTVVEYADRLLPMEDADISKEMERLLKKRGITIHTSASLEAESVVVVDGVVQAQIEQKGKKLQLAAQKMLVSVGRAANVEGLGLENTDVAVERGVIVVNEYMQTKEPHIYAIGDVNGGLQLAHAASYEGLLAVAHACGQAVEPMDAHLIPRCIYSRPEAASVGITEAAAKEQGYRIKTAKYSFKPLGKALVSGDNDGFVKVIADEDTNDILGVHMIGPHVTELISEAALAQVLSATPWEVGQTIHPHPALSEALAEAMLMIDGSATSI